MKIKEILEATAFQSIEDIAKNILTIDETQARKALVQSGCFKWAHEKTKWQLDEDQNPAHLEQSIYHFHELANRTPKLLWSYMTERKKQ